MGALTSIPLCQRVRAEQGDANNNTEQEDRNLALAHIQQVVEVQPEATSTPKVGSRRRIEPLPEDRDLGDSSNSDSLESDVEARPVSERTFGSDSGLEQSSDELEVAREVAREVPKEGEEVEVDDLDTALESEEETVESLETGDLGVDRGTTFRATKEEDLDMEDLEDFSEPLPNEDDDEDEEEDEEEEDGEESQVSKKLAALGVNEEEAISALLSDMTGGGREVEEGRGMAGR